MPAILLVDDDPHFRAILTDVLAEEGYTVATARDGATGFARAQQERFDLILLDLTMPVLDGWGFLRARAADPTVGQLPVIVLSATNATAAQATKWLGATRILLKPFDVDVLLLVVAELVGPA